MVSNTKAALQSKPGILCCYLDVEFDNNIVLTKAVKKKREEKLEGYRGWHECIRCWIVNKQFKKNTISRKSVLRIDNQNNWRGVINERFRDIYHDFFKLKPFSGNYYKLYRPYKRLSDGNGIHRWDVPTFRWPVRCSYHWATRDQTKEWRLHRYWLVIVVTRVIGHGVPFVGERANRNACRDPIQWTDFAENPTQCLVGVQSADSKDGVGVQGLTWKALSY